MDELIDALQSIKKRIDAMKAALRYSEKDDHLKQLSEQMSAPDFWSDRATAQKVSQESVRLERWISVWKRMEHRLDAALAVAADDRADHAATLHDELEAERAALEQELEAKELEMLLDEPHDERPAILTIYSGAGGVDAQDWAEMLSRMYLRFAATHGYTATVLQRTSGQSAGIKNMTLRIEGDHAYGYLKNEAGVHRLVRLSPYDADHARHTSFAMVEVLPELDEPDTVEVPADDVRIDVFRSSGHGGQSVNTTDSAVRLTHLPTGITVSCQNERSQLQNKNQAWKMLLGKLAAYYSAQRDEERQLLRGEFTENAWGSQIRSYVLHPYKMVKDHRTKFESKDPQSVLDGDVLPFIEAELRARSMEKHSS